MFKGRCLVGGLRSFNSCVDDVCLDTVACLVLARGGASEAERASCLAWIADCNFSQRVQDPSEIGHGLRHAPP
eukprot:10477228-Alexandrium_andersonii.AAC.2